jgi:hypothetical protein
MALFRRWKPAGRMPRCCACLPARSVVSVGPKCISSQEIDLLPMTSRVEVVVRAAWDSYKEWECGSPVALPVKEADVGRRKKKMHSGLLCLGLGLKMGVGLTRLRSRVDWAGIRICFRVGCAGIWVGLAGPRVGFRVESVFSS